MALERLPPDVLAHILCDFLDGEDACRALDALYGIPERGDAALAAHVIARVPAELRVSFALHHMRAGMRAMLHSLAHACLHTARGTAHVHAFLDWTPFASVGTGLIPCPAAEYRWDGAPPQAIVALNEAVIDGAVRRHAARGLPCATVAVYRTVRAERTAVLVPQPVHMFVHPVYPAALLAASD